MLIGLVFLLLSVSHASAQEVDPSLVWMKGLDYGPIGASSVVLFDIDNDGYDEIIVGTYKGRWTGNRMRSGLPPPGLSEP